MFCVVPQLPLVLVRDDDALLCWSIEQHLRRNYRVGTCADFSALRTGMASTALVAIIIGADGHDEEVGALPALVADRGVQIIGLVAAIDCILPQGVLRLDKPFSLGALTVALRWGQAAHRYRAGGRPT